MENNFKDLASTIVSENLAEINVETLARQLNLDPSQVYRKIKKRTDHSIAIFIRNICLDKAELLLRKTDLSIKEIGYQVGFNEISYFTRYFKEAYRITPSHYRNSFLITF